MTRHVYFAFDYDDVMAVNEIRNSQMVLSSWDAPAFHDRASREKVRKDDDRAIAAWIRRNMEGSSVTIVCIGPKTIGSKWVRYEIDQSVEKGNGILGISMSGMKYADAGRSFIMGGGENPLNHVRVVNDNGRLRLPLTLLGDAGARSLSTFKNTYSWLDNGPTSIARWIEVAAKQVGR